MSISFHIDFNDQCQEAFEYYADVLGGKIGVMLTFKDSPSAPAVPQNRLNKIVHANIFIDGVELAGADLDVKQYQPPKGFFVLLGASTEEKVKSIFNSLAMGGTVIFPPQKTFWSSCYGIVVDRFGVPWKINCE